MKNIRITLLVLSLICAAAGKVSAASPQTNPDQTIFVFGGDIDTKFIQYVADLTNKPDPKICYVPTASADDENNIKYWEYICKKLSIDVYVLKVWVSSSRTTQTFEEILLGMDAIVVGGGNTLNMMGIWKAQGIDRVMKKALEKGIVLAGGSAGSICWFQNGISDSRPVKMSVVNGLSLLPYSNCPHYKDSAYRELFHQKIIRKEINPGYASDNYSGILFKNGKFITAVSLSDIHNSYYVSIKNGTIHAQKLDTEIVTFKNAISPEDYDVTDVDKKVNDFPGIYDQTTPLNAYISVIYALADGRKSQYKKMSSYYLQDKLPDDSADSPPDKAKRDRFMNAGIVKVLVYNDSVAGVINRTYKDFYGLWFFYKENGKWVSAGEDMGGETIFESEIRFREKAPMDMKKVRELPPVEQ